MILTPKHRNNGKAVLVMERHFTRRKMLFGAQYTLCMTSKQEFLEGNTSKAVLLMETTFTCRKKHLDDKMSYK